MIKLNLQIDEVLSMDLWESLSDRELGDVDLVTILDDDGKAFKTLSAGDYEYLQEHIECDVEAVLEYWQEVDEGADIKDILERLLFPNTEENWREYIVEVLMIPEKLESYMDWDRIIRDAMMEHTYTDNWVFTE